MGKENITTLSNKQTTDIQKKQFIDIFFHQQLQIWNDAKQHFEDIKHVQTKPLMVGNIEMQVQFNAARIVSTGAKIDKKTLVDRPCFLCLHNRPKMQMVQVIDQDFELLINPYPILPQHFTIPLRRHEPQNIAPHYSEIYKLLTIYPQLMVFYNGPKCGASAPDHAHLQAGSCGILPLQKTWSILSQHLQIVVSLNKYAALSIITAYPCHAFCIVSREKEDSNRLFSMLYRALPLQKNETEPMMNIVAWRQGEDYIAVVFPRKKHRPDCYFAKGDEQMLISPGALDMAGLIITPRERDFKKLNSTKVENILKEMTISDKELDNTLSKLKAFSTNEDEKKEPKVSVGIVNAKQICFALNQSYICQEKPIRGCQKVEFEAGSILWNGQYHHELCFTPQTDSATFSLNDVTIGINFHWERKEIQTFHGTLRFIINGDKICAINQLPVENYLESVISSEMKATSSLELLKAHAVISRSWLLAQIQKHQHLEKNKTTESSFFKDKNKLIHWYDREDHTLFDVCADDHCQRYQGITKETNKYVVKAIQQTRGEILMYNGEICDTRFSKCCGGISEEYRYCWENITKPYLSPVRDIAKNDREQIPDLTNENNAEIWIRNTPDAFCNTHNKKILSQVLNDYDQETIDFYRWEVTYTQQELRMLIEEKLGMELGDILDLVVLERGKSGRIYLLKIIGSLQSFTIGKELEIRRTLSKTHLYSSAFVVNKQDVMNGVPRKFVITGAGWGHGVGLCQIGAAVMGEQGCHYTDILKHYYSGSQIAQMYQ